MAGMQPSGSLKRTAPKRPACNGQEDAALVMKSAYLRQVPLLAGSDPGNALDRVAPSEDTDLMAFKRRKRRQALLKRAILPLAGLMIMATAAAGYWVNVSGNIPDNSLFWQNNLAVSQQKSGFKAIDTRFNPIHRPSDELSAMAENTESYSLLGLQNPEMTPALMTVEDPLDISGDASGTMLAEGRHDPFEPILLPSGEQSGIGPDGEAAPLEESLQIQFSGVVDDPATKRKVAILKILNPDHVLNSNAPEYLTIVKKANEKFTVSDKSVVIKSISNQSATVLVDGKALSIPLNTFNAAAAEDGMKPVSLTGANAINANVGNGQTPPAPMPSSGNASITPANNNSNATILKLQE
ncbi:MAG: hypothetical protein VKJ04_09175 [Vampirovibrionales bacterium]|nr:hypothetical protein [Vampirovibrionales bacterium]